MGNVFGPPKKVTKNFHHLKIKSLIERCSLLGLLKTLLFLTKISDNPTNTDNKVLEIMINGALGRYKRMQDHDTVELVTMIINEQCRLNHPEKALEYTTLFLDHVHGGLYSNLINECRKRHNYMMYQLGLSHTLSDFGNLHVSELSYDSLCQYIRLGHYIHKFGYNDNNPLTNLLHIVFREYTSLRMPLFKYFPGVSDHARHVLGEIYQIFVPYKNAGNIDVILSLYDHKPDALLIDIPFKYGLCVNPDGKIKYIND